MPVSEKLSHEIYNIELWHIVSLMLFVGISLIIFLKAKKTPLLYSYLAAELCVILWIVSKIFKTVSPDIDTRWFFIVTQYLGVTLLSGSLLTFALLYSRKKPLKSAQLLAIFVPCFLNFLLVATNPRHMLFYSKYTFYSDSFGPLFYASMALTYAYIAVSAVLLAKGFIKMFGEERRRAILFSAAILIPVAVNVFYIAKLFQLLFDYRPLFDYTPIAINVSLLLFAVAAFRYRFFDVLPVAGQSVFHGLGDPAAILDREGKVIAANGKYETIVKQGFIYQESNFKDGKEIVFLDKVYRVRLAAIKKNRSLFRLEDVTEINALVDAAKSKNAELSEANNRLSRLLEKRKELAVIQNRHSLLQEMHDIMGHSAVLALSYCEREAVRGYSAYDAALLKVKELIASGSKAFQESIRAEETVKKQGSLIAEIKRMTEESGFVTSLIVQGEKRELRADAAAAVLSILREAITNAVKYSGATTFDVVLRFDKELFSLFILDNGRGCNLITAGAGLDGMRRKAEALGGSISFASFAGGGFRVYLKLFGRDAYAV